MLVDSLVGQWQRRLEHYKVQIELHKVLTTFTNERYVTTRTVIEFHSSDWQQSSGVPDWEWFQAARTHMKQRVACWRSGGRMGTGSQAPGFALKFIQAVANQVILHELCAASRTLPVSRNLIVMKWL